MKHSHTYYVTKYVDKLIASIKPYVENAYWGQRKTGSNRLDKWNTIEKGLSEINKITKLYALIKHC